MAARQAATDLEKTERAKDKRLRKKFGITIEQFKQRDAEQQHKCAICGGPVDAYGPAHVDHYHFKIEIEGAKGVGWTATVLDEIGEVALGVMWPTQAGAIKEAKRLAMPWSVRGLLCFKCNKGLGVIARFFGAESNPDILLSIREYLRKRLTNPKYYYTIDLEK